MRNPYISALLFLVVLSGCSVMPVGEPEPTLEPEPVVPVAQLEIPIEVDIPQIRSGNEALFDRALELMEGDQLEAAEVLLLEITESQTNLAGPWVNLGLIAERRNDNSSAEASYLKAIEANPANCDALNQLGVLAREAGEFDQAETYYKRCVEANPAYPRAHLNLAILYELYLGRLTDALASYQAYQRALKEPDNLVAGWQMDLERRVNALAKR